MLLHVMFGGVIMKKWFFVVTILLTVLILAATLFFPKHVKAPTRAFQPTPYMDE